MMTNEKKPGTEQLELGFDRAMVPLGPAAGERRLKRAAWWFEQMHRVVNQALDWRASAPARPQQEWLPCLSREPRLG
jgi:hypothetical protein